MPKSHQMILEVIPLADINPAPYNPRLNLKPGDPDYEKLKKSIMEFNMVEPLVYNKKSGNLVGGHQRLKVLQELGYTEVEVSVVNLSDTKEKAQNLALNKISGDWDYPLLKDLLESLDTGIIDMEITGFDLGEIEDLMTQFHVPGEGLTDDDAIPEEVETVCKAGDLWILNDHRLLCGDATKKEDVERLMGGEKADMVFTDPPYGIGLDTRYSKAPKGSARSALKGKEPAMHDYSPVVGDNKPFDASVVLSFLGDIKEQFWFGADYYRRSLSDKDTDGSWLVWDKRSIDTDTVIGSGFELIWSRQSHKRDLLRFYWNGVFGDKEARGRFHPTQKPTSIIMEIFKRWGKEGQIVLDPFGGSGSTLIACEKLGRRCFMMEIDEHYCDVIIQRWQNFTGKEVVKI